MDSAAAQVRASAIQVVRGYVEERGGAFASLLDRAGLSRDLLDDHIAIVSLARVVDLFEVVSGYLKDPCFGLHLSADVRPGGTGLLGKLALCAPTARDALRTTVRFARVYMTNVDMGYREKDGLVYTHWVLPAEITSPRLQYSSFFSAIIVRRLASSIGGGWRPLKCEFAHRAFDCPQEAAAIFGERLEFDRPVNEFVLDRNSLDRPMPGADAATFAVYEDLARRWADETDCTQNPDIIVTVREHILLALGRQRVDLNSISGSMGLGERILQRRLDRAGTSFEKVLMDTRRGLAQQLLKDTDRSLTEIAFDLGYSDPSVFTRAAHRWFDMSPKQFRQLHRTVG